MNYYSLRYSLKVWLSSVFLAPLIYDIIQLCFNRSHPDPITDLYGYIVLFELVFSFFTWLIFWGITLVIRKVLSAGYLQKVLLSVAGIILTIGTFLLVFYPDVNAIFSKDNIFLNLVLSNCFCIGSASWIFNLEPEVTQNQEAGNQSFTLL